MTSPSAVTSLPAHRRRAWSTATSDRQVLQEILKAWNQGEPPDAAAVLARHPQLAHDRDAVVDLAYEEYCLRVEDGEPIDKGTFAARFAPFTKEVRDTLDAHSFAADHLDLISLAPTLAELQPGDHLLGFTLLRELGEGSFSRVFLASEQALGGRLVAIKVSVRGAAEAETLGRLNHPNIVPVHSFHEDPDTGLTLVCMPYLGNATLADLLDRVLPGPRTPGHARLILDTIDAVALAELPGGAPVLQPAPPAPVLRHGTYVEGVLHLGIQLADALAFIHRQGICHRDLKPANVLLGRDGEPRLLDFNLSFDELLTGRRLGGTPPYTAPEQMRALAAGAEDPAAPLDARADLFSLGVLLFELLTGEHPFGPIPDKLPPEDMFPLLLQRHREGPALLLRANRFLGAKATTLLEQCLAFDRADRPATAAEVCAELRRALSALQQTRLRTRRRTWGLLAAGVLLLAAGLAGATYVATQNSPAPAQGEQAYTDGQVAEAERELTVPLNAEPNPAGALFARGRTKQQLGQYPAAIEDYQLAADLQKDGRALACMGYCMNCMGRLNDYRAAATCYEKALALGFRTPEVYNNLGYSYMQNPPPNPGKTLDWCEKARDCYDQAIGLNPNLQAAFYNRARVDHAVALYRTGYLPLRGLSDIETALQIGPATADLYHNAARLYGVAMERDPQFSEQAFHHLRLALENGWNPSNASQDSSLRLLRGDDEFQRLIAQPAYPKPIAKCVVVLDPVQDRVN
jgi:serine/threonine protein kinase